MSDGDGDGAQKLQNYAILGRIGRGSFGKVYQVVDTKSNEKQKYAMKKIPLNTLIPSSKDEVSILKSFQFPFVTAYIDSFEVNSHLYIIMEFCAGGDLSKLILNYRNSGKHFEEHLIKIWFLQLILALQCCHNSGVLHRDLAPKNLFIMESGELKLGDFGMSKLLAEAASGTMSSTRGTAIYCPPEVLRCEGFSYKADIWACGCILFEMLVLEPAFANVVQVCNGSSCWLPFERCRCDLRRIPSNYNKAFAALIQLMLKVKPNDRPTMQSILAQPFLQEPLKELRQNYDLIPVPSGKRGKYVTAEKPIPGVSRPSLSSISKTEFDSQCSSYQGVDPVGSYEGSFPIVDWSTLQGDKCWSEQWYNIVSGGAAQNSHSNYLLFPPMVLPYQIGGWTLVATMWRVNSRLVIQGGYQRLGPLSNPPPERLHLQCSVRLEISRMDDTPLILAKEEIITLNTAWVTRWFDFHIPNWRKINPRTPPRANFSVLRKISEVDPRMVLSEEKFSVWECCEKSEYY